ncbi:MAG: M28 family peptidase [Spirochaetales bacterium]|nr:M28 family peptidase [Spirochaetales bacterium]
MSFDENNAWSLLRELASRGKRAPGTKEHRESIQYLFRIMNSLCPGTWLQPFSLQFRGNRIECANICGFIQGKDTTSTILIGSHFDTRWIADNDNDEAKRNLPIPGVNDGTSGVVIILELARVFRNILPAKNVLFVLFDAEDLGNIDGFDFSIGADYYAKSGEIKPDLVIALDMVGGKDMHLNIDVNSLSFPQSKKTFNTLFSIGRNFGYPCFYKNTIHMIISDHYPFLQKEIPAIILIDIDYPQWHTHADTIDHCSKDSLKYIGNVLFSFLMEQEIV